MSNSYPDGPKNRGRSLRSMRAEGKLPKGAQPGDTPLRDPRLKEGAERAAEKVKDTARASATKVKNTAKDWAKRLSPKF